MTLIGIHGVKRSGQLEVGGWYWIKGPASDGLPFHKQAFRVGRIEPATATGRETVRGLLIVEIGGRVYVYEDHLIYASSLDDQDTGQHFEKLTTPTAIDGREYVDIIQQRKAAR